MATAHVNEMGIVFRKFNPIEHNPAWWDSLLNELKAEHVPGLQQTGKRMTVDPLAPGGFAGIVYFTPNTVGLDEAIPILKKHRVDVYDVRRVKPFADILTKYGWNVASDHYTWTHPARPDQKIILTKPMSWFLLVLDNKAQDDYRTVAQGISSAELEECLS